MRHSQAQADPPAAPERAAEFEGFTREGEPKLRRARLTRRVSLRRGDGGGTRITFETAWLRVPRSEALTAPLVRAMARRSNQRSMARPAELLQAGKAGGTAS